MTEEYDLCNTWNPSYCLSYQQVLDTNPLINYHSIKKMQTSTFYLIFSYMHTIISIAFHILQEKMIVWQLPFFSSQTLRQESDIYGLWIWLHNFLFMFQKSNIFTCHHSNCIIFKLMWNSCTECCIGSSIFFFFNTYLFPFTSMQFSVLLPKGWTNSSPKKFWAPLPQGLSLWYW